MKKELSEGQTPIDDISGLRLRITTRQELDRAEFENNLECSKKYFLKKLRDGDAPFNYGWLLQVHREMFGQVWEWAGHVRKTEKPIGVTPVKIGAETHAFISDYHRWAHEKMATFDISVRIHHRLVAIHPFENGNGRWSRMVTNIYLHQQGLAIIEWPNDVRTFRGEYLRALKEADRGDLKPLTALQRQYWPGTQSK